MNRGTFFKSLVAGLLAAPAVARVITETEQRHVKRWRLNPAWENAPYEVRFEYYRDSFKRLTPESYRGIHLGVDKNPYRFDSDMRLVNQFISA